MAILNVSVVCLSTKTTTLPWNIVCASESEHSFRNFFEQSIRPCIPSTSIVSLIIVKVEVGTSKDKLDLVDLNLVIGRVVESFGRFVKYSVRKKELSPCPVTSDVKRNAFEVLMDSQRSLQSKKLPDPVEERNRKDRLYNNILHLLEFKRLQLECSEVHCFGDRLVRALCDTLVH